MPLPCRVRDGKKSSEGKSFITWGSHHREGQSFNGLWTSIQNQATWLALLCGKEKPSNSISKQGHPLYQTCPSIQSDPREMNPHFSAFHNCSFLSFMESRDFYYYRKIPSSTWWPPVRKWLIYNKNQPYQIQIVLVIPLFILLLISEQEEHLSKEEV